MRRLTQLATLAALLLPCALTAQAFGVAATGALGRTPPLDRAMLDREKSVGLLLALHPMSRRSMELHLELGGSSRRPFLADAVRWSVTASPAWHHPVGPMRISVVPGVGLQRISVEAAGNIVEVHGVHARMATRADVRLFPGVRAFAEASVTYARLLAGGEATLNRVASPSPPCTTGVCLNPFRDAWTGTLRGGLMALLF